MGDVPATSSAADRLLRRIRQELAAWFSDAPLRIAFAPGRLDVMGGIGALTGVTLLQGGIDASAAVALQTDASRQLQIFSFDRLDAHQPFTFGISLDALASAPAARLVEELAEPGRHWAAGIVGLLRLLHDQNYLDWRSPAIGGLRLALLSDIPPDAGLGEDASRLGAVLLAIADEFGLRVPQAPRPLADAVVAAALCADAHRLYTGRPLDVVEPLTCLLAERGALVQWDPQRRVVGPPVRYPQAVTFVAIDSGERDPNRPARVTAASVAAQAAYRLVLQVMEEIGQAAGRELIGDPLKGFLANLDPDDYKSIFRARLPEHASGDQLRQLCGEIAGLDPAANYAIRRAADHHVLEARRVRRFAAFLQQALADRTLHGRGSSLDRAGHLMYASSLSYTMDAMLGSPGCDRLIDELRRRERAGLYGARITADGCGGSVAVMARETDQANSAMDDARTNAELAAAVRVLGYARSAVWEQKSLRLAWREN